MTRKRFFSSLGALCLSAALILSSTTYVKAEENAGAAATTKNAATVTPGDATVTPGDATVTPGDAGDNNDTTEPTKIPTPTGLTWKGIWEAQWDGSAKSDGLYTVELYKDGKIFLNGDWGWEGGADVPLSAEFNYDIFENGTYKFRVRALGGFGSENKLSSDWSEFSPEKVYVRPDKEMGTTTPYFKDGDGYLYFDRVEGAKLYDIKCYRKGNWENAKFSLWSSNWYSDWNNSEELKYYIGSDINYAGQYYYTVQALSDNIDEIAHGQEGPASEIFDTETNADLVSNKIDTAITNSSTAAEAVAKLTANTTKFALQNAMHNNAEVLQKVADLDARHMAETGVSIENVVSSDASAYVNVNDIKLVGAALNANSGKIGLDVSIPEEKENVDGNKYKNIVQLDIKLVNDGNEVGALKMPVNITMPIPTGLNADELVILHYSADGSFEVVKRIINADNTVTFTVSHFSNFVFAEANDGGSTGGSGTTAATPAPVATSPKTANTSSYAVFVLLMAAGFFGLTAVVCKKREY